MSDLPQGIESGQLPHDGQAAMNSLLLGLAPDKVYMPFTVTGNAVVSYPAISLLTPFASKQAKRAVSFLLHLCTLTGPLLSRKVSCPVVPGLSSAASYLYALQRLPGLPLIVKILYALIFRDTNNIFKISKEVFQERPEALYWCHFQRQYPWCNAGSVA